LVAAGLAATVAGGPAAASGCPSNLAASLASTGSAAQLITVDASGYASTRASVRLWRKAGGCWVAAGGPWGARVGRNGLSDHHVEGDGTTPTGAYGLGPVVYGVAPDPGVRYPYHRLVCGDWWDENSASPGYNTFQHVPCGAKPSFARPGDYELRLSKRAYRHFIPIRYNTDPAVPGRGSAIFLHDDWGSPTHGCITIAASRLETVLRWLRPAAKPLIVIGTKGELKRF
jgi:L,D-peptidoglycan transpeptidase YkuD (ErfK/YbiS/YcfS/YnhG family)